jgi:hypothetical protein
MTWSPIYPHPFPSPQGEGFSNPSLDEGRVGEGSVLGGASLRDNANELAECWYQGQKRLNPIRCRDEDYDGNRKRAEILLMLGQ